MNNIERRFESSLRDEQQALRDVDSAKDAVASAQAALKLARVAYADAKKRTSVWARALASGVEYFVEEKSE